MKSKKPSSIDEYISTFPEEVQKLLQSVRKVIRDAAPDAEEAIKYDLPTFVQNGNVVHFGAFKTHIGFYPIPSSIEKFEKELSKYKMGKGSVQFPFSEPIPLDLISRIVKFRIKTMKEESKARSA